MSAPSPPRQINALNPAPRPAPKPYSIERRFRLMQAGSFAFGLLLISTVLYWNQTFDRRLELALSQLHATLVLETQFHARHETTELAFWEGYFAKQQGPAPAFEEESRELKQLVDRFVAFPFPADDRAAVDDLHRLEESFRSLTGRLMVAPAARRKTTHNCRK